VTVAALLKAKQRKLRKYTWGCKGVAFALSARNPLLHRALTDTSWKGAMREH